MSNAPWYGALVAIPFVAAAAASANDFIQKLEARVAASEHTLVIENLDVDLLRTVLRQRLRRAVETAQKSCTGSVDTQRGVRR